MTPREHFDWFWVRYLRRRGWRVEWSTERLTLAATQWETAWEETYAKAQGLRDLIAAVRRVLDGPKVPPTP